MSIIVANTYLLWPPSGIFRPRSWECTPELRHCCYAAKEYSERSWRRLAVSGRYLVDPDEPQPVDQQIDNLVVVLLQQKHELDRAQAHAALRETVDRLLAEGTQ
jgi:hypothetical protein